MDMNKFGVLLLAAGVMLVSIPAFAQTDFSGEWVLKDNEVFESAGQPPLGDYLGIPFNEAGRMRAETSAESMWAIPEFQCRPHSAPYQWRGLGGLRFIKEIDPVSRELTAYHVQFWRSLDRPIYLDGRPHPPGMRLIAGPVSPLENGLATLWSSRPRISKTAIFGGAALKPAMRTR